jgi:hypothetical protein
MLLWLAQRERNGGSEALEQFEDEPVNDEKQHYHSSRSQYSASQRLTRHASNQGKPKFLPTA